MNFRILGLFLFFHSLPFSAEENSIFPSSIDFGSESESENFATYPELSTWASYQGWRLDPDGDWMGIRNQICRMVPEGGLEFQLRRDPMIKKDIFLHLDLTRYTPRTGRALNPRVLRVFVNGNLKKEVEVAGQENFRNPVSIRLSPADYPDSRIRVRLEPSGPLRKGRYWGIWDVFLSENQVEY